MLRIAHSGDWHPRSNGTIGGKLVIDPMTGLSQSLTDFQKSLDWMYDVLIGKSVDVLLVAGDVFDTHKPSMDELRVVMKFLRQCVNLGIEVFVIPGNHDISQSGTMASALTPLHHIDKVNVMEKPGSDIFYMKNDQTLGIDFLPYPSRGRMLAQLVGMDIKSNEEVTQKINDGLFDILERLQMDHKKTDFKILLAHGTVDGIKVGEQPRTIANDIFLPIKNFEDHYDYIALGHIHQKQEICEKGQYCGSLIRQGFGEEVEPKGFLIVDFEKGQVPQRRFIANPHARTYRTLKRFELPFENGDPAVVYRLKDEIREADIPLVMPLVQQFTAMYPFAQVNLEVVNPDRQRDAQMNNQMSSSQAVDRSLERDGTGEPLLGLIRELHQELVRGNA